MALQAVYKENGGGWSTERAAAFYNAHSSWQS